MFHIVDDIAEMRDVLRDLIACAGQETMQFDSAESYLDYFNSNDYVAPIAILTDYKMTGMTGLQLIKKVREKAPLQKAVIVSGTPCSEFVLNIETYLCYSLTKPYKIDELFALLKALEECDHHYRSGSGNFPDRCHYNLDHECPFNPDKSTSAKK